MTLSGVGGAVPDAAPARAALHQRVLAGVQQEVVHRDTRQRPVGQLGVNWNA
ncbi:hypothetical protein ACFUNF_09105 [Streptomyces sp. NPDC057291]|uniref:hypothetical protein n=1 Tax=Streptomyces sp. NPDC057291 TaxID=3346087 RepID=UPI00363FFF06